MPGINGSYAEGMSPQASSIKTPEHAGTYKDTNVKSAGASPVVGATGATASTVVSSRYALHALSSVLNSAAPCPEFKDERHFEAQLSELLVASKLTLDGLQKKLKTIPEPNQWAADALKDKTIRTLLNAGGPLSLGRSKVLADRFAKAIAKAVKASSKEMAGRDIKTQKPVVTDDQKKAEAEPVNVEKNKKEAVKESKSTAEATDKRSSQRTTTAPEAGADEGVKGGGATQSASSDKASSTSLQSKLESLWSELKKHNAGLDRPAAQSSDDALYAIDDLLYESGMTTGQLKSALTAISEPWAQACLVDSTMARHMKTASSRVSDSARSLAEIVLSYMNGKPAEKKPEQASPKQSHNQKNEKPSGKNSQSSSGASESKGYSYSAGKQSTANGSEKPSASQSKPSRNAGNARSGKKQFDDSRFFTEDRYGSAYTGSRFSAGSRGQRQSYAGFDGSYFFTGDNYGSAYSGPRSSAGSRRQRPSYTGFYDSHFFTGHEQYDRYGSSYGGSTSSSRTRSNRSSDSGFDESYFFEEPGQRSGTGPSSSGYRSSSSSDDGFFGGGSPLPKAKPQANQTKNEKLNDILSQLSEEKVQKEADAKLILGFKAGQTVSRSAVNKAFRALVLTYHDDKFTPINTEMLTGEVKKKEEEAQKAQASTYFKLLVPARDQLHLLLESISDDAC